MRNPLGCLICHDLTAAESDNYIEAPALTFPDVVPYGRNVVYTRNLRRN